ncbi:helix-turn-helix transcriptional regulator [Streptomyces sp. NPDC004250]|uniref:helix-turn-helix transcriptional regulator n=1 Tax=Streptomyces sp. NPDC004250 TaxID=3364692 RepID=UPI0036A71D3B
MTTTEIAAEHGVSRQTIHTYRRTGIFPSPVEGEGSTRPRFREDEVIAFFEANPKQPRKKRRPQPEQQGEPVTTTTDPRIAILSALNEPPYNEVAEKRCVPWDEAEKMLGAYRAKEWRLAAESIEQEFLRGPVESERDEIWNDAIRAAATVLRQEAQQPEVQDG